MSIYEILEEIEKLSPDDYVDEDGVFDEEGFNKALDGLNIARDEKIENIALYRKNLIAEASAVKEEAKSLTERAKRLENKAERMKNYLSVALMGEKFSTPRVAITWRKSESVVCDDVSVLPEQFTRVKTTIDPDKTLIKEALKNGEVIEGCRLETTNNIQIK